MKLGPDVDHAVVGKRTPGYVGADIVSLTKEAGSIAISRIFTGSLKDRLLPALPVVPTAPLAPPTVAMEETAAEGAGEQQEAETSMDLVSEPAPEPASESASEPKPEAGAVNEAKTSPTYAVEPMGDVDGSMSDGVHTTAEGEVTAVERETAATAQSEDPEMLASLPVGDAVGPSDRLTSSELEPLMLTMEDFLNAVKVVQPTAKREGFATAPDVSWKDVGALSGVRDELSMAVLEPITFPGATVLAEALESLTPHASLPARMHPPYRDPVPLQSASRPWGCLCLRAYSCMGLQAVARPYSPKPWPMRVALTSSVSRARSCWTNSSASPKRQCGVSSSGRVPPPPASSFSTS